MPTDILDRLLEDLFRIHGYKTTRDAALEGRSGAVYGAPVLAETEERILLVERCLADEPVNAATVSELGRVVMDTGAHMGILVACGPVEEGTHDACDAQVILWDQATLARLIGEAQLAEAAGTTVGTLPLDPAQSARPTATAETGGGPATTPTENLPGSLADMLPPAFQDPSLPVFGEDDDPPAKGPEEPESPEGEDEPMLPFDLDMFDSLGSDETPTTTPPDPPGIPDDAMLHGPSALPPRIDKAHAVQTATDRLFGVHRTDLVLHPVHLFDYECDLLVEGSLQYDTVRGRLEVHGTDKTVRDVDPLVMEPAKVRPLTPELTAITEERVLRIEPERAQELARAFLMQTHTRVVEIETGDPDDDYAITERKKVAPRSDQIRIEGLGTVMRPVWRLRGQNGSLHVDGLDGRILDTELRTPDPDIVMLD